MTNNEDLALQDSKRAGLVSHMAEPFVQSASENLGKLLVEEADHLQGIEDKIGELQDALDLMLCFLRDADANQYGNKLLQRWVEQIIGVAYEAECTVEKIIFEAASNRPEALGDQLKRYLCISREVKTLRDVGSDIDSLMQRVNSFVSRLQTYGVETTYVTRKKGRYGSSERTPVRQTYSFLKEDVVMGLDDDISRIVIQLLKGGGESKVFVICGKAGLGKTTLAKKIYRQDDIRRHFDSFSWANVPSQCHIKGVLQGILGDITSKSMKQIAEKSDEALIKELSDFQKEKKCLIILDGLCKNETWDALKGAFPSGDSGSRLLITTCNKELVQHVDPGAIVHEPCCLSYDHSWDLLQTKLGSVVFGDDVPTMIKIGQHLVRQCEGLPLAIVLLGGLLSVRSNFKEWKMYHEKVFSCLERAKECEQSTLAVFLELSYSDLPYYLKPCFLHLASFRDGYEIPTEKLCQIWVADGFVVMTKEGSLDDVAESYLIELEQRGLIQAGKRGSSGRMKTCYLHDLLRDLCSSKAAAEDFLNPMVDSNAYESPGDSYKMDKRFHRLAMYPHEAMNSILSFSSVKSANIRSFMFLTANFLQVESSGWLRIVCKEFQLLRVLDLEGAGIEELPKDVGELIFLRYLSLRGTRLRKLPSSIGNLRFLQTLDLRVSLNRVDLMIPNVLWKMERLRHLLLPYYNNGISEKLRLGKLSHLKTLKNLDIGIFHATDLLKLTSIKRLSLNNWLSEKETLKIIRETPSNVSGLLKRLSLRIYGDLLNNDPGLLFHFQALRRLEIMRRISVPLSTNILPLKLEVLTLKCCYLEHDPMLILERLPRLRSLFLDWDSFLGSRIVCSAGGFPQLIGLKFDSLPNLTDWIVEEGAMTNLKKLEIKYCGKLITIPDRLPRWVEITCHRRADEIQRSFSGLLC